MFLPVLIVVLALAGLVVFPAGKRKMSGFRLVGADELPALAARENALILDVRTTEEFGRGHIPGAISIPLSFLAERLGELPRDRKIIAVCSRGRRSAAAAGKLTAAGFPEAYSLAGGLTVWRGELDK